MVKGKKLTYQVGSRKYSVKQLLDFGGVRAALPGRTTTGFLREKVRKILQGKDKGKITPDMLTGPGANARDKGAFYGAQRARAGEPLRTTGGVGVEGPRRFHDTFYEGPHDPNSPPPMDPRYGGQRKNEPLRNSKGQEVQGPKKGRSCLGRGGMQFLGVRRSAREASHYFPKNFPIEKKIRDAYNFLP